MKLRRMVSCMMALLLVCSLPVSAFAAEYDLAQGSVTVNATESGQTVTHGSNAAVPDSAPVITQSNSSTPTTNTITITATENATANVTIQNVNIVISDPTDNPQNHSGDAAVTIDVATGAEANVTLDGVSIDVGGTGGINPGGDSFAGEAAVQIVGNGDVTMELDGKNTIQGGYKRAGVEKNAIAATDTDSGSGNGKLTITDENETHGSLKANGGDYGAGIGGGGNGSGSNITITGSAEVTATGGTHGAGIGGGYYGSGSNIEITGSAEVTATGGTHGAGIGGGIRGSGSDITVSQDAQVKAQGGNATGAWGGAGAAIGNGGAYHQDGQEVPPNTDELTPNGKIEYYAPGADIKTADPTKTVTGTYVPPQPTEPVQPAQPEEEAPQIAAPYRVVGQDGKALAFEKQQKGGVLTITVDADFATLTGSASGLKTLKAQGIDTIVFETNGATSTFALADLLAQGGSTDTYALTHVGSTVTLTLGSGVDVSSILK